MVDVAVPWLCRFPTLQWIVTGCVFTHRPAGRGGGGQLQKQAQEIIYNPAKLLPCRPSPRATAPTGQDLEDPVQEG